MKRIANIKILATSLTLALIPVGIALASGGGGGEHGGGGNVLGIDIRVVIAQGLGFIVVFWVLKKFLFGPLGKAMDERRAHIKNTLDKVAEDRTEMEKLKADYETRLQNVEAEARTKIQEAIKKADTIGEEIKSRKQAEADEFLSKAQDSLDREYDLTLVKLKSEITELTLKASSKLIQTELDTQKHRDLIGKFIDELELETAN